MTNISKSIMIAMANRGIRTQKDLATLSHVGEMTISNIMSGKSKPSVEIVEKISLSLGYLMSDFCALGEEND